TELDRPGLDRSVEGIEVERLDVAFVDANFLAPLVEETDPVTEVSDFCYFAWHKTSFRRKHSWTLLNVSGQTFFGVLALEQDLLVLTLHGQSRFHGNLPPGLHGPLDASHSLRGLVWRRELACIFHDVFHEAIALENVVHNAEILCFFERERIAGDHKFDGFAFPDQARQALRSAGAGKHAEVDLGQADLAGVFAGDAEVGSHGDL